ncbi:MULTISPECIES: hypothetical protein [unclassified Methylocystis]|jgi:hypothetical protein|uniref:hypothetical protein n=1 Tax=unclassified Methylocystis TaxID=2625913 RepID=UPI00040223E9|nr:hypothetical protein [Methylocystis sp. SB2]ULO24451.1 hypothetical protein LNB28_03330 [Methylocystis sp. SB2]
MNRIVREHYPAAKLPEELRDGIDSNATVTITVEIEPPPEQILSLEEMFALRRDVFMSIRDVDEHVSAMRDEWSH